jgi:uncharacterized SAM-binding protein YcdF (DUF218 family)
MFFFLSKILWTLVAPVSLLVILLVGGVALMMTRFARAGRALVYASAVGFIVLGSLPVGINMVRVLEDRFPTPPADIPAPAGIIVLGGAVNENVTRYRGPVELTSGGDRMTEATILARRFPEAKLVFTGGSAALLGSPHREAHAAEKLFLGLGLPREQLVFESESRNTYENVIFTRELVKPQKGQTWLLVTSAMHMPRAVGIFRKAGLDITPYPVDFKTTGRWSERVRPTTDILSGLYLVDRALREYIGLAAYWWTGKQDVLFPAP